MTTGLKLNERKSDEVSIMIGQGSHIVYQILDIVDKNRSSALKKTLDAERKALPYQIAEAQECYSDELYQAMESRNLSQVEFANKAQVSKQFITKVFHGGNCTIETLVKLAFALDYKLNIHLTPNEVGCAWLHHIDGVVPRQTKQVSNLWAESGYKSTLVINEEFDREKVTT
jgi:transcriptional regulator with XRE-family HTH domain